MKKEVNPADRSHEHIMGLSLDNLLSIGGLQALKNIRRGMTKDASPSEAKFYSSHKEIALSTRDDTPSRPKVLEVPDQKRDPRVNPFVNLDEANRNRQTEGIGDRAYGQTNSTPVETPKLYPLSTNDYADSSTVNVESQSQEEVQKLRGAIVQISKQFLLTNQNPELDDLKTEIDAHLGSGIADLFDVRLQDQGNGVSAVSVDQLQYNDLGYTDKQTFNTAIASVDASFGSLDLARTLEGSDITKNLNELRTVVGLEGTAMVDELERALSAPGDVQQTLNDFYKQATDIGLSDSDQESLKNIVDQLKSADSKVTQSFDANSLLDDLKVKFTSNRYGPAYSPSSIATNAALTANTIFLAK